MNWKFWQKQPTQAATSGGVKLPRPKKIHSSMGRHLVVAMGKDPDWVWSLKGVSRPRGNPKNAFDIRVFDDFKARGKGIVVKNYLTLDAHPDLILFEGWHDKDSGAVELTQNG